jgi:L-rhamnose isomerase/sugar isomerase
VSSATEILRCFVQASLVNRTELETAQASNDVMAGHRILKQAFITDVSPSLRKRANAMAAP